VAERLPAGFLLPPVELGGIALHPGPLVIGLPSLEAQAAVCEDGETRLGSLCATVEDDRILVVGSRTPRLLVVTTPRGDLVAPVATGRSAVIAGLTPGTSVRLTGTILDLAGEEEGFDVWLETAAPRPHVILTEVMANPIGPEPAQEWVEVANDSSSEVSVAGFTLTDAVGSSALPPAVLAPGAHALIVGAGFDPASPSDVPPRPGTPLFRVPRIGGNGLTNSGEALTLRDAAGGVLSRFPAVAARGAGMSVARARFSTPDDAVSEFTQGAPTPGWSDPSK
jgi:hypothetical protein